MNVAFLFDSSHPFLGVIPGYAALRRILETQVLQNSDRHVRVSIGDVLTLRATYEKGGTTTDDLREPSRHTFVPKKLDLLVRDRLETTFGKAEIYSMLFQNLTASLAVELHQALNDGGPYLGAMDVDFSNPVQLQLFRNSLVESFRLRGHTCSIFYTAINDDPDIALRIHFEENGYTVEYEDSGLRRTIFDDYDSLDHFQRIGDFMEAFDGLGGLSEDQVSDLTLSLEELHPKLFEEFAAATRTLTRAESEADMAQVSTSGRRLLTHMADYLFPPRPELRNGRKVGNEQYKNRLWAYIEDTLLDTGNPDQALLQKLGKEADRLVELFCSGLHGSATRAEVEQSLADLVILLSNVIDLSPQHARRPYLAFEKNLRASVSGYLQESKSDQAGTGED